MCGLVLSQTALVRAQEAILPTASPVSPKSGFYIGGHVGVLTGSASLSDPAVSGPPGRSIDLFHPYDLTDGSGSHVGGLSAGYDHRWKSGVVFGGVADIAFGAEPAGADDSTTEIAGSLRGRIGFGRARWFPYATGGFAWARDRFSTGAGSSSTSFVSQRVGWTVGAGVDRALDTRWSVNAEYLYTRFGSPVSSNQLRLGLRYALDNDVGSMSQPLGIAPLDVGGWSVHGQTTFVFQYAAPFRAPYHGTNSLDPNHGRETWDVTFYVGRELWTGAALWINPEIDQGYGLSNTLGVAGFTSGEAYKLGYTHPYVRIPRAFLQQTFNLGGASEMVETFLSEIRTR